MNIHECQIIANYFTENADMLAQAAEIYKVESVLSNDFPEVPDIADYYTMFLLGRVDYSKEYSEHQNKISKMLVELAEKMGVDASALKEVLD